MTVLEDRGWAAFTDDGPWEVRRDDLRWAPIAVTLRDAAQAEVPDLTRARLVPPGRRVVRVVGTLALAVLPWLWRSRRGRFADPAAAIGRAHV